MAYAYDACYGYYIQEYNAQSPTDGAGLDSVYTTDADFVITDDYTLFVLPESLQQPSPVTSGSTTDWSTALNRATTLTEYDYGTQLPSILPNQEDFTGYLFTLGIKHMELLFPGSFYYCRGLIKDLGDYYIPKFKKGRFVTFVWLKELNLIIAHNGVVYSVNPNTNLITRSSSGSAFHLFAYYSTFGILINPARLTYTANFAFNYRLDNNWYSADGHFQYIENVNDHTKTTYYFIWSTRQAQNSAYINNMFVGTPEKPKYKYKTDPADKTTDPYTPPFDPYGPSKPGGGTGTHDPNPGNDPAPIPDITQMTSILDTDFMTAYKMTAGGLKNLGAFLWSQSFYGAIASVLNSPFDVIIGLHIVPVNPSIESSARAILLGNVDSNIAGYRVTSQYVEKDLGGFDVPHIWGAYLDYQGKFEIFLPFIGFRSIAADDIVGHQIRVKYHIDVVTGACIAYVLTDDYVTYTFAGSCSYNIPVTGQNFSNIVASMIQTAGTIGMAAIAPEGMGAAGAMAAAGSALNTAMSKPTYSRSGGMGGNNAFMGMRTPVLIARVPNIAIPGNQNKIVGYPSFITRTLSEVHGYTEVYKVHLEGIGASDTEKSEIETALMEGVIL